MQAAGGSSSVPSPLPRPQPPSASSSSSSSAAALTSVQQFAEDQLFSHLADELTFNEDRKLETERALMEDLMESLRKEEKLLDADAWKYAAPRSQLHLTSMSGITWAKGQSSSSINTNNRDDQHLIR